LIIIVIYLIETLFDFAFDHYLKKHTIPNDMSIWISFIPRVLYLLFNIITAIIIFIDIKRFELKSRFLVLMTIVIGPLGVCTFLISLVYNSNNDEKKVCP